MPRSRSLAKPTSCTMRSRAKRLAVSTMMVLDLLEHRRKARPCLYGIRTAVPSEGFNRLALPLVAILLGTDVRRRAGTQIGECWSRRLEWPSHGQPPAAAQRPTPHPDVLRRSGRRQLSPGSSRSECAGGHTPTIFSDPIDLERSCHGFPASLLDFCVICVTQSLLTLHRLPWPGNASLCNHGSGA